MKILQYIEQLLPRLEKSNILEDIRVTLSELDTVVIPSYKTAAEIFKVNKFKSEVNKELTTDFYNKFDLQHGSKQSSFIADINKRLPMLRDNLEYLGEEIEKILDRDVISDGLTAKKAFIIRSVESISFMSRYSTDLLNSVYVNETTTPDSSESALSPAVVKHVTNNIGKFAIIVSDYGIPNVDFSKIIIKTPDVVINSKTINSIKGVFKEEDIDPFSSRMVSGFTYSPIYHIRLIIAEWQSSRYKANKDKKKLLELRLLNLKLQQENKFDTKVENEINYIQSRVDKIERYLTEVETSLEEKE